MEFQFLRVFVQVAHRGGITAAADVLGIAKSAVSKQLSELESLLKVQLFERSSRRISITKAGEALLPRAESILAEVERLVGEAREEKTQISGTVKISASPEFGAILSKTFLPKLLAQNPQLKVLMRLEYEMDDLHDPSFDLAFRLGSMGDDRLVGRRIGEFDRILVCSPDFARANRILKPEGLSVLPALLFSDVQLKTQWVLQAAEGKAREISVNVDGRLGIRGFNALLTAAEAGLGFARLPSFVAMSAIERGSLVQFLPTWRATPASVFIAYRTGVMNIGRVRAVIDTAVAEIPELLKVANTTGQI